MNFEKSDAAVGAFVLGAAAVLLAVAVVLNHSRVTAPTYPLTIELQNIAGIDKGVEVVYRGYQAGAVESVKIAYEPQFRFVVGLAVKREIRLREGTRVAVRSKGFGGAKLLELIPPAGMGGPMVEEGAELPAEVDPDLMTKAGDVMGEVQEAVRDLQGKGLAQDLLGAARQARSSLSRLDGTLERMSRLLERNEDALGRTLGSVEKASSHLPAVVVNLEELTAELKRHPWRMVRKGKEGPPLALTHRHAPAVSSSTVPAPGD